MVASKILFLDLDGPLFPYRTIRWHPANRYNTEFVRHLDGVKLDYWKMDDLGVEMLKHLHSIHPFELVISSTWSRIYNLDQIKTVFRWNGLELPIHTDWTTPKRIRHDRASEIYDWLDDHPEVDGYIILDDPHSGEHLEGYASIGKLSKDHLVMVNPDVGISSYEFGMMLNIVRGWAGLPSTQGTMLWM